jgi:hypothetical protein
MKFAKRILGFLVVTLPIGAMLYFAVNSQDIFDWWKLRDYTPSAEIEQLSNSSGMNDYGQKLFYLHDPALLQKSEFRGSCTVGEETIVLGCYISNDRIYIYDVRDDRLDGVEQVTAAHEMLHAAYDRLSPKEKERIDALLNEAYDRLDDLRIQENIASYRQRDPSVVTNELHSILGTEVRELPRDLEEYYSLYFTDRSTVVALAERYVGEFEVREKQIQNFDSQLSQLNGQITRGDIELQQEANALQDELRLVEQLGPSDASYARAVTLYNEKVRSYNARISEVSALVDQYNAIVEERNKIAVEERQLVEAIDTRGVEL